MPCIQYHLYADGSQTCISFKTDSSVELQMAKSKVELCVKNIYTWMVRNYIMAQSNQDKSELLVFQSKFRDEPILNCINVVDQRIKAVSRARNLRVVFDSFFLLFKNM